jgi:hypothetical protein
MEVRNGIRPKTGGQGREVRAEEKSEDGRASKQALRTTGSLSILYFLISRLLHQASFFEVPPRAGFT